MRLFICIFATSQQDAQSIAQVLSTERYIINQLHTPKEFLQFIENRKEEVDCLIFVTNDNHQELLTQLSQQGTLLPVIITEDRTPASTSFQPTTSNIHNFNNNSGNYLYHSGEIRMAWSERDRIGTYIDRAITQFLHLAPSCALPENLVKERVKTEPDRSFLLLQQRRLAEKLKERLGYLGVYYKRNPQYFCRNLPQEERQELLGQLTTEYRDIILEYFSQNEQINQQIDRFVNHAFFADVSVSQILEIHMELIDEFSQQLKLEGRSEEVLLDYRLALIDIIAHLCEMYRRSIPREDLPFELLFRID